MWRRRWTRCTAEGVKRARCRRRAPGVPPRPVRACGLWRREGENSRPQSRRPWGGTRGIGACRWSCLGLEGLGLDGLGLEGLGRRGFLVEENRHEENRQVENRREENRREENRQEGNRLCEHGMLVR